MKTKTKLKITTALAVVFSALLGCRPATFTPRIVANDDGTYTTEFYYPHPGYQKDPNAYHVSLEAARAAAKSWAETATNKGPRIVE